MLKVLLALLDEFRLILETGAKLSKKDSQVLEKKILAITKKI